MKRVFGKIEKICNTCNKLFLTHRYRRESALFCSRKCKGVAHSVARKGILPKNISSLAGWNKGKKMKPHSLETIAKRTASLREAYKSPELRKKLSDLHKGEKSYLWKGGITPINQALRTTFEYNEWRKSVFERDNYICQGCGKVGGYLEADHIKRFADYPELRLELSNGQTLCRPCHLEKMRIEMKGGYYYA